MSTGWGGNFVNKNPNAGSNNNYGSPSRQNYIKPVRQNTKLGENGKLNTLKIIGILIGILIIVYIILYILHVKNKLEINLGIFPKSKKDSKK